MADLRHWQLTSAKSFALPLAADSRLSRTDYADDQIWELLLGTAESPALALQTQYGGRANLVSLVPMWLYENRTIYQTQAYTKPPVITAFAPGYLRSEAKLLPNLNLQAEFWAMESHAVGARYSLRNTGTQTIKLRLDVFGHVVVSSKEQDLGIVALRDGHNALFVGKIANIEPVVLMEKARAITDSDTTPSAKIGVDLNIPAKGDIVVRWVHTGLHKMVDSLALAQHWMHQDWDAHFAVIVRAAQSIPVIETGKSDLDMLIAASYQQLVLSFLTPTGSLPYGSFIATRQPGQGFSPQGDGSDYNRQWDGQEPTLAYLTAAAVASIAPNLAQGIIRNYLAIQREDGWIDRKPGLGGQRQAMLCQPILARLTWAIYQSTEDQAFLNEVFPGLFKFFERWFQPDLDYDQDGLPEWQSERQTGYMYMPTFGTSQSWAQNADIRAVETPDMAAYLLSEAISLRTMAQTLKHKATLKTLDKRITALQMLLENLWQDSHYTYRDRDTHLTTASVTIIKGGRADEEHLPALPLSPVNRLIVRIIGGGNLVPHTTLHLDGLDQNGQAVHETADSEAFVWSYGRGVYTSQHVFTQIDRVRLEGMSRVYKIDVETVDTTRLDINALLPLWSTGISPERAAALVDLLTDKKHFWQPNGVTMCSAQDANFAASNAEGCGAVWPFWLTLIGEGLLDYGYLPQAADLFKRLLAAQLAVVGQQRRFYEFYHSEEPQGLGERGHVAGIVPLHFFMRAIGVRIIASGKVWTGGTFAWDKPITITQHGVTVKLSKVGTQITFPSGYTVTLKPEDGWQAVVDPNPVQLPPVTPIASSPPPNQSTHTSPKSVKIEVDYEPKE
jgi:hypothetical protein